MTYIVVFAFKSPADYFKYSRDHRALPSFPTRRSSDLDLLPGKARRPRPDGDIRNRVSTGDIVSAVELAVEQDRKSTRLNSSHGYISYAVFCLKKKNC